MKKIIGVLVAINLCILTFIGSLAFLAETYPFQPGDRLFGLQHMAEQVRLGLAGGAASQAEMALDLAERRLADLAMAEEDSQIVFAVDAFESSLHQAVQHTGKASVAAQGALYKRLDQLLIQADIVVSGMAPSGQLPAVAELSAQILALQSAQTEADLQAIVPPSPSRPSEVTAAIVSFLGKDVEHEEFPLTGGHADLECMTCHEDGLYADTSANCEACHLNPTEPDPFMADFPLVSNPPPIYATHFAGECSDCHTIDDWQPYQFNHNEVLECLSCHAEDLPTLVSKPENIAYYSFVAHRPALTYVLDDDEAHYPGDCIACHSETTTWEAASFDHLAISECESCHQKETPALHYPGTCNGCHSDYQDWTVAIINHSGYNDCLSCHATQVPSEHYPGVCTECHTSAGWFSVVYDHDGASNCRTCHTAPAGHYNHQCANCHTTSDWGKAEFNHKGFPDCQGCHAAPAGHYTGQCSTCHTTGTWRHSVFLHLSSLDCMSCHSNVAPSNHYTMACSSCHGFEDWGNASFNHFDSADCLACHKPPSGHYTGQCSNCHNTTAWGEVKFDHTNYTDCMTCHAAPDGHYTNQCSFCHTVQDWSEVTFNHTGYVDCWSCHTAPESHYPGQCSNCHSTNNWAEINFDHTGQDNCSGCHQPPDGHWPGQCSNCHVTGTWDEIHFDHTNYTNCKTCHIRPADHPRGQCSNCHTTDSWIIPTTTPTMAEYISAISTSMRDKTIRRKSTPEPGDQPVGPTVPLPVPVPIDVIGTPVPYPTTSVPVATPTPQVE